jgi:Ca2+-binding EF-hand superfamily protein
MRRLDDDKDGVICYDELYRALNMVRWDHIKQKEEGEAGNPYSTHSHKGVLY